MNNRTLLFIFIAVLLIFLATKMLRKDHGASFDPILSSVDTTKVDRIHFLSAENDEFELVKAGTTWKAVKGPAEIDVPLANVSPLLSHLSSLRADRVVTKEQSRYGAYEITEDQSSSIIVYENGKEVTNLILGGFRFDQQSRTAKAFARKNDNPEVYEVDGFALMGLKQTFDQYRDNTIIKSEVNDLTKIEWSNGGRKEAISKEDGIWHYAGMEAVDSISMQTYLLGLVNTNGKEFSTLTIAPAGNPVEKVTLFGNNMIEPIIVTAYMNSDTARPFLIHSSQNGDAIFLSDSLGIYKRIFGDLRQFWPNGQ